MKRLLYFILALVLCSNLARAATETVKPAATNTQALEVAKALTKITGIAISPLLGVGVVGAYDWFAATTPEEKAKMPWYAQMKFWLPALLMVGAVALKDGAGAALPPGWKKPLDVLETVENKITGLVAAGAIVPSIATIFHSQLTSSADPAVMQAGMLGVSFAPLLNILTIPLAVTAFVLVWMVGHVIHVLILISPWGAVDAALKTMRTSLVAFLGGLSLIKPEYAAGLSLVIIVISYFLAGWSFRLMVFGSSYTWDFCTLRYKRFKVKPNANWMFTSRPIEKTPIRTYGKLVRGDAGEFTFEYRPWLFLPARQQALPQGQYALGRGLFYPEILLVEGEKTRTQLVLPPRYKSHEDEVAQAYAIRDIRDVGLLKGLKAIWNWLKGGSSQPAAALT